MYTQRESSAVKFLTGNEAEMIEVIQHQGARFDAVLPNPEFQGKKGEQIRASLAINKLTGMPVMAAQYTMNGVAGLLVSDHQMSCYRAMAEKGASSTALHDGINAAGKVLPVFEGYDENLAGKFAGFGNSTPITDATYGDITITRDGKLTVDNSMKYIYQEIMNINGDVANQAINEEGARALFKSGLGKADEALNILKGDGLRVALRRSIAIETFIMFVYKSNPQAFTQAVQSYQQTIRQQIASNIDKQTTTMLELEASQKLGTELLTNMDSLAKCIVEEAELNKQRYLLTASGDRPVNQIDEAFVYELLETLADPNKPSMSQTILNTEILGLDSIQAGAKMIGRLNKLAKGSIKVYSGDIVPFFPVMPRGESEEIIVNKMAKWLGQTFNQDFSQLPFHYMAAKNNNGSFTDTKNGAAFFGMGQQNSNGPATLSDALGIGAGNQQGATQGFNNNNNGALKGAFDAVIGKLGGTQGQGTFGNTQQQQGAFGTGTQQAFGQQQSFGGTQGFGGNANQSQSGYAATINGMLKQNNNIGGTNMWINNGGFGAQQGFGGTGFGQQQGNGFGAVTNNLVLISLNGIDYAMNTAETEATPHGVAARVYNAQGQLVGGVLPDGKCMDVNYNYVGTAVHKQQVQQQAFGQQQGGFGTVGFGAQQGNGFGSTGFGAQQGGFGAAGFGQQQGGFGTVGFGQQQGNGFGSTGFGAQQGGFGAAGFGQQQGFGGTGLRANPVNNQGFGMGRVMQMI